MKATSSRNTSAAITKSRYVFRMKALVVLSTAPDLKTAKSIARHLVARKLAACVSVKGGFSSCYRWKGKIENSTEALLLIKTSRRNFSKLKHHLESYHPYEVPEIVGIPIVEGSPTYLSWLNRCLEK